MKTAAHSRDEFEYQGRAMNKLNEHDKLTHAYFDKWATWFEETGFVFKALLPFVIMMA